jgi:hypothetical protein
VAATAAVGPVGTEIGLLSSVASPENLVMDQDPVVDARALVEERFPQARWAVLAGSVITAHRTAGSDLDIVVLLPTDDPLAPHRDSCYFRGWPVELFVHDERTLAHYLAKELPLRKPHLHRMVARSVVLIGDPSRWRADCDGVLANGPAPLTAAERDYARYGLTDLLDDLVHSVDPGEKTVIAATAWTTAAQQALAFADRWAGNGKWLLRELREMDRELADRWLAAFGDAEAIEAVARDVLDRVGGPLFDGFRAIGERPSS